MLENTPQKDINFSVMLVRCILNNTGFAIKKQITPGKMKCISDK